MAAPPSHLRRCLAACQASSLLSTSAFPGITQATGEANIDVLGSPPRVVWCPPQNEVISWPGGLPEGGNGTGGSNAGDGLNNPRTLWFRLIRVPIYLWGAKLLGDLSIDPAATDFDHWDALEALYYAVVQAIHQQMWVGYFYTPIAVDWDDTRQAIKAGRGGRLLVEFRLPLTAVPETTVTVASTPVTQEYTNPATGGTTDYPI